MEGFFLMDLRCLIESPRITDFQAMRVKDPTQVETQAPNYQDASLPDRLGNANTHHQLFLQLANEFHLR